MAPGPGRAPAPAAPARSAAPLGRDLEDLVEMCTKLGQVPARPATPLSKEGKSLHQNSKRMILFRREIQRNTDAAFEQRTVRGETESEPVGSRTDTVARGNVGVLVG